MALSLSLFFRMPLYLHVWGGHMNIHEESQLNSCSLQSWAVVCRHLPRKSVSRELRGWVAILCHRGGRPAIGLMGGVISFCYQQFFLGSLQSPDVCCTEFQCSLTAIISLFGTLFRSPKRLPGLCQRYSMQNNFF